MTNTQVAEMLDEIALLLELAGGNPLTIRSYADSARILEGIGEPVETLVATARLHELDGIGDAMQTEIVECVGTGRLEHLENLRMRFPEEMLELLHVPGLDPGKIRVLHEVHHIASPERLRHACETGELAGINGFSHAMQQKVLQGLEAVEGQRRHFRVNDAMLAAHLIIDWLRDSPGLKCIEIAGSLRRRKEFVKDINIMATGTHPEALVDRFAALPEWATLTSRVPDRASALVTVGIPVDLRVFPVSQFPFALAYFTGSRAHNAVLRQRARARGLRLSEHGLFAEDGAPLRCADETVVYSALDMPYVPPELRENQGEFDAAFFPRLIEPADIRGVVHCHSTWSDGKATVEQFAGAAAGLGYDYLVITDHSCSAVLSNGMRPERVLQQHAEIDTLNARSGDFRILKGVEADIGPDGSLDYDDELLSRFEVVIASVHGALEMTEKEATLRAVRAIENPHTMILGHPTGRMLLSRPGYPLNMDKVIDAAVANGVALEINVNPGRFDLDWRHLRRARDRGAKFVLGPDAHRIRGLNNIPYGVGVAKKGWLRREDVLNCQPWEAFLQCLR